MPTVLITGANRGIGLEFTRQFAADGWAVHASCRNPDNADELNAVEGDVTVYKADITSESDLAAFAGAVSGPVDLLIANAGVMGPNGDAQEFGSLDFDGWDETFRVNTMGPLRTAEAFLPAVEKAKGKIVAITSKMGSIEDASSGRIIYRSTKCGLNMAMNMVAAACASKGIAVATLHPGWVRTDMGGPNGLIDTTESVSGLRKVIDGLAPQETAPFLDYAGKTIPW